MTRREEWRDLPGYNGFYQVSNLGRLRSFRDKHHKGARLETPVALNPSRSKYGFYVVIKWEGKQRTLPVGKAVALTFLGNIPKGCVAYHRDGNPENNRIHNIAIGKRSEVSRKVMREKVAGRNRKPVLKINRELEIVEAYPSTCKAARANGYRQDEMWRFCTLAIAFSVFAPDDFIYTFDDDKWVRKALERARAELAALGIRYNEPHTEEYYNLPITPELAIDPDVLWSEVPACGGGGGTLLEST